MNEFGKNINFNIGTNFGFKTKQDSEILSKNSIKRDKTKATFNNGIVKVFKFKQKHYKLIKNLEDIIKLPSKNEQYIIVTQLSFNAFTFILYISEREKINNLTITTFNMNEKTINALMDMLDNNEINKLTVVISESVSFRMPKRLEQLQKEAKARKNMKLGMVWNHTKIALIETEKNWYVLEGSGNFSDNSEIEQYRFENSKETYDFHKNWIEKYIFQQKRKKRHYVIE